MITKISYDRDLLGNEVRILLTGGITGMSRC